MLFKKKYKFDNSNTLLLLADTKKMSRREEDLERIDKLIGKIKENKVMYAKLVFTLALALNSNNSIYAQNNDMGLEDVSFEIIHMVLIFGKYGCLGIGLKNMIEEMLAGANLKEATGAGVQYFIFYIILQLYPRLFNMIKF